MRLSIIIPAYNEARTIGAVLAAIDRLPWERLRCRRQVIVVDDGSTDGTAEAAERLLRDARRLETPPASPEAPADIRPSDEDQDYLIRHAANRGKGAAVRSGLALASGDAVLLQDADLEYPPANYPALLTPFIEHAALAVYGSRFRLAPHPSGMPLANYLANTLGTWLANRLYGLALSDMATGQKLFDRAALDRMELEASGFELCAELTAKAARLGIPILEAPIAYVARSAAQGKKFTWRHSVPVLRTILRYRRFAPDDPSGQRMAPQPGRAARVRSEEAEENVTRAGRAR
jgi:glycosyltransferase involved in cell wall biosynthesis